MKKLVIFLLSIALIVTFAGLSMAQEKKPAEPAKKAESAKKAEKEKPAKVLRITGEVKAVDAAAKTITIVKKVKDKMVETVVTVDDKTAITLGKEKKTLADVKAGDKVTVKYTVVDKKNVAKSVAIAAAPPKKAEPAKPAKPAEPAKPKAPEKKVPGY